MPNGPCLSNRIFSPKLPSLLGISLQCQRFTKSKYSGELCSNDLCQLNNAYSYRKFHNNWYYVDPVLCRERIGNRIYQYKWTCAITITFFSFKTAGGIFVTAIFSWVKITGRSWNGTRWYVNLYGNSIMINIRLLRLKVS